MYFKLMDDSAICSLNCAQQRQPQNFSLSHFAGDTIISFNERLVRRWARPMKCLLGQLFTLRNVPRHSSQGLYLATNFRRNPRIAIRKMSTTTSKPTPSALTFDLEAKCSVSLFCSLSLFSDYVRHRQVYKITLFESLLQWWELNRRNSF